MDWDQVGKDESLGKAAINLADLEPFHSTERILSLQQPKGTKGTVTIRVVFKPGFVARTRKTNTSTFSVAGRAVTQVGGLPFNVIKGTAQGVGTVGSKTFGLLRKNKITEDNETPLASGAVPDPPSTQISQPADMTDALKASGETSLPIVDSSVPLAKATPPTEPGTLKVTVASAKDLIGASVGDSVKPYVVLKIGKRECQTKHTGKTVTPEWYVLARIESSPLSYVVLRRNEHFLFPVGPETQALSVTLWDHKTLAKDKVLAETDIDVCLSPFAQT